MIRHLESNEPHLCVEGGKLFFDEGKLPGGFVPEIFIKNWERIIRDRRGTIIGAFDGETITGALGAVLCPDLNNGQIMAVECFWYVIPQYRGNGVRLLKEFERWSCASGAKRLAMIHLLELQPEALGQLYQRMGYRPIEINYIKEVNA